MSEPSEVRASVSGTASNAILPSSTRTAVRQQPLTATESPSAVVAAVTGASSSRRIPVPTAAIEATRPTSLTIPVNISPLLRSFAVGERLHGLSHEHLQVAAFTGERVSEGLLQLQDRLPLSGSEVAHAELLDPLSQLVVPERAHEPLREQADDLVVGALELGGRGHGSQVAGTRR